MAFILDGHTLGFIIGNHFQILRASRNSPHPNMGILSLPMNMNRLTPATQTDFANFNVQWHPDYSS